MQYKIPQNVQIEDKIVGPLTLKQLIILGVGGGFTYVIYIVLAEQYFWEVWLPATLPPALLTLAFAFLKIKGIPFGKWILLFIEYMKNPRKRTFIMGSGDLYSATLFAKKQKKSKKEDEAMKSKAERDQEKMKNIASISKMIDSYSTPPKQS